MLSYTDTIERLRILRDDTRTVLSTETADRQVQLEETERRLTALLGELVTPNAELCMSCMDNGAETKAVAWTDGGEGVCDGHIIVTLLAGTGVRTSLDVINRMNDRLSRLGLASFLN
jgi:hypothetical protein